MGLVGCAHCAIFAHMGIQIMLPFAMQVANMYLYLYVTMYFIRNENGVTVLRSINAKSVNWVAPSLAVQPRESLPSQHAQGPWQGTQLFTRAHFCKNPGGIRADF